MNTRTSFVFYAFLALIYTVGRADALPINGGFETGTFTGWSTIGDAIVVDSSFGTTPAEGTKQALISNAPSIPSPNDISGTYSGNPSVAAFGFPAGVDPLDGFLGFPNDTLLNFFHTIGGSPSFPTWEGSAIKQSFSANPGDTLIFSWNYLTNEARFPLDDFAFIVLNGSLTFLADGTSTSAGSGTGFRFESGYHLFATTLTTSGPQSIAFGIVDTANDPDVNSAVLVDKFSVRALPEASTLLLFVFGLVVLAIFHRNRDKFFGRSAG